MRLVNGADVYEIADEFVAAAFIASGWTEQAESEKPEQAEKPKRQRKTKADQADE